jgi:hypothetical protein
MHLYRSTGKMGFIGKRNQMAKLIQIKHIDAIFALKLCE